MDSRAGGQRHVWVTLADARPRTRGCRKARAATDLPNDKKRMNPSKHLFRADVNRPDP